jgi:lipopolysaccharide assembly outer membrane protein LptD (OstA)
MLELNACQLEGWHYIYSTHDIEFILEQTNGFHDSVLKEMNYVSGSHVDNKNHMHCNDSVRQVTMWFDSQWCRSIELVFEGVVSLNLRPFSNNEPSYLYDASLFLQDKTVFFFDSEINEIDNSYDGTWIASCGLRWRFYGEEKEILPLLPSPSIK